MLKETLNRARTGSLSREGSDDDMWSVASEDALQVTYGGSGRNERIRV